MKDGVTVLRRPRIHRLEFLIGAWQLSMEKNGKTHDTAHDYASRLRQCTRVLTVVNFSELVRTSPEERFERLMEVGTPKANSQKVCNLVEKFIAWAVNAYGLDNLL